MPLQHQSTEESRYDAETLRKVTALAERLQRERQETLTAQQMEDIGAEVGLEAPFIRQALESVTAEPESLEVQTAPNVTMRKAIAAAWWAAGWTLPLMLLMMGSSLLSNKAGTLIGFFFGWAVYIAGGIILSGLVREAKATNAHVGENVPHSRADLIHALSALQARTGGPVQHRVVLSVAVASIHAVHTGDANDAVEQSYSEFRKWAEEISRAYGGQLLGAAGDGMAFMFPEEVAALRAARALQTGIPRFNVELNRLSQPFRLRCGLSAGQIGTVTGALHGPMHGPLVDRAAHLLQSAGPGDIVVGAELAAAGLVELGGLAPISAPGSDPVFSWQAAQRRMDG